jgi:hypothetical protein
MGDYGATFRILARASCVGMPRDISRSKRPARRSAGSRESGRFVAPAGIPVQVSHRVSSGSQNPVSGKNRPGLCTPSACPLRQKSQGKVQPNSLSRDDCAGLSYAAQG